jgi:hypothetical protein
MRTLFRPSSGPGGGASDSGSGPGGRGRLWLGSWGARAALARVLGAARAALARVLGAARAAVPDSAAMARAPAEVPAPAEAPLAVVVAAADDLGPVARIRWLYDRREEGTCEFARHLLAPVDDSRSRLSSTADRRDRVVRNCVASSRHGAITLPSSIGASDTRAGGARTGAATLGPCLLTGQGCGDLGPWATAKQCGKQ